MSPESGAAATIREHILFDSDEASGDKAPWRQLPELPTAAELLASDTTTNDLPSFHIDRSFETKAQYLEALYRILRYEAVEGLRYSVNSFRSDPTMNDDDNTYVYTKVFTKGYFMTKLGPTSRISFSTCRAGRRILWKQAKRLTPACVVALSSDNFQTDCRVATVSQRPIEGGLDQCPPTVDIIWANTDDSIINTDHELVMIESRNGYYEAARHALLGLQHAAVETSNFDKYLLWLDADDAPSLSVARSPYFNLACLINQLTPQQHAETEGNKTIERMTFNRIAEQYKQCNMLHDLNKLGITQHTSLDSSQLEALQRMVAMEMAVIQGPPGTGKTFTSVQAVKTMLDNRRPDDPPIIVAAQTNHALDQLLVHCHNAGAKVMRLGGRTENEVIKERTVYNLRMSLGKAASHDGKYRSLEKSRLQIIDAFKTLVDGVYGDRGLVDPRALLEAGVINESQFESLSNDEWEGDDDEPPMQVWLGEERIERSRQPPEDLNFEEEEEADEHGFELNLNPEDETVDDEDDRLRGTWIPFTSQYTGNTPRVPGWHTKCVASLDRNDDLYQIPVSLRGGVYQILQSKLQESSAARFRQILKEAVIHAKHQKVNKWLSDLTVLEKHCIDIVGCTTTGLTKYRGFLSATGARILLIEEAAETREANVTSALFSSLDQLVLVGDHQQLPPHCDIARLGGEPFNLNISLFERMVRNRVPYTVLNRQRRMAPELRYIVEKYYPGLKDHPSVEDVKNRPLIPGMGSRRSWFFTHEWPEESDADNSKFNAQEAQMMVAFMRYLVQNGVKPSEMTVLTYYRGQRKRILQLLRRDAPYFGTGCLKVATVDSYQGEENDIVLLSLVRSPPTPYHVKRVGFVESLNRATVAISRARRGFFMFGNKKNLFESTIQSFDTWAPVWNGFAEQRRVAVDKGLPLICQNHDDKWATNEIWMKSADEFVGNAGGCWVKCGSLLPCGHACVLTCHAYPHNNLPCMQPCRKVLSCGHKCSCICTDQCRCCKNCHGFNVAQADEHNSLLQLEGAPTRNSTFPAQACDSSPEKWVEFSKNPGFHDDIIRQARRREIDASVQNAQEHNINERFISSSNLDGVRVLGQAQHFVHNQNQTLGQAQHQSDAKVNNAEGKDKGRHLNSDGQRRGAPATQTQAHSPAKNPRPQYPLRPHNQRNTGTQVRGPGGRSSRRTGSQQAQRRSNRQTPSQQANRSAYPHLLDNTLAPVAPGGSPVVADSTCLIEEFDLGFEAEVLGIRRGGYPLVTREVTDPNAMRERPREHIASDTESLMSFSDDDAKLPARRNDPAQSAQLVDMDDVEELLIDI